MLVFPWSLVERVRSEQPDQSRPAGLAADKGVDREPPSRGVIESPIENLVNISVLDLPLIGRPSGATILRPLVRPEVHPVAGTRNFPWGVAGDRRSGPS